MVEIQTVPILVKLSKRSNKYIEAFTGLTLLYDFTCKDVMYVLGQTLNPDSKLKFWGKLLLLEINGLGVEQWKRGNTK